MILSIDLALITWVLVLNAVGYWLKSTPVAKWYIPLTAIEVVLGIVIATAWGWFVDMPGSFAEALDSMVHYGLPSGLFISFLAVNLYDIIHGLTKNKAKWLSLAQRFLSLFKKKEAKA